MALGDSIGCNSKSATYNKKFKSHDEMTVIGQGRKAACVTLRNRTPMRDSRNKMSDGDKFGASHGISGTSTDCQLNVVSGSFPAAESSDKEVAQRYMDCRERRERELKFTAAGWKRDCHGKWYKDPNVSLLFYEPK